ncbi:small nucleolar ribonucleoprotein-like protein complex subunit [Plenodomus tracheiphilus IPT5]|uniref:Small nucleolar ribonucleoprotein-like protein complex subunit n=1 Tax=Plenodomus tracheiphilus IPT5 TaxID=1408161 RepID=A0A6A7BPU0_9PLEO|nr:small nucleolar ribonucleoprotein-like protein complex subunit [Plenodomus tracheiphilus IPT5]
MDIHRARFVPYPPSAINALAFSHTEAEHGHQDPKSLRLAIGRANGNIEIWNPANGAWLQEKVFHGGKDRSVEGLAWTQEPDEKDAHGKTTPGRLRLFSIGYSSSVTEWDLVTGLPARHSNGNHSEVWCFAAQPRVRSAGGGNATHQKLVAGCADGTIVLLSTEDNDLTFERFVSRATNKKARALSIAYKDHDTVLAGFADSMIRVFDTRNGNVIRNISLGSGPHGGPKEILVWKVKCLPTGDFVSGDSTGDIRIYNGKNYSQTQRISGHEADVLDLAVSRDGSSIFSAGMDRRTCFYTSKKGAAQGQSGKWRKVSHQRYHEHDVKAMATYEGNKLSVVVSGGIDTQPIVVPLRQFGKELSRGLPALPPTPPLVSAPEARLLVSWWNTEIRIWRVKPQNDGTDKPKVVARLALQGEENITSVSISRDGGLLAAATASEVKLFQLLHPQPGAGVALRIRKLEMPSIAGANIVNVAANGKWVAAATATNDIQLVRIVRSDDPSDAPRPLDKVQHLHRLPRADAIPNPLNGPSGSYERSIIHTDFTRDGDVFAVVDLAGHIDTWVTEGHEDSTAPEIDIDDSSPAAVDDDESGDDEEDEIEEQITFLGQRWIQNPSSHLFPRLDATPVLLSFRPNSTESAKPEPNGNPAVHPTRHNPHPHSHDLPTAEHSLLLVSADHQLYLFDVMSGRLSEWSRRNPQSSYPREYKQLDLPAKGCIWDISDSQQRIWLYGEKWLFMFDLTKDFSTSDAENAKKRKREALKHSSGAGGAVPQVEAPVTKMRKFQGTPADETAQSKWVDVNAIGATTVVDEEDDEEESGQPLATFRRPSTTNGQHVNGDLTNGDLEGREVGEATDTRKQSWWHTFKYRPILGMVQISGDDTFHAPEVVLVERPSWDLDLPPRFVGMHEQ